MLKYIRERNKRCIIPLRTNPELSDVPTETLLTLGISKEQCDLLAANGYQSLGALDGRELDPQMVPEAARLRPLLAKGFREYLLLFIQVLQQDGNYVIVGLRQSGLTLQGIADCLELTREAVRVREKKMAQTLNLITEPLLMMLETDGVITGDAIERYVADQALADIIRYVQHYSKRYRKLRFSDKCIRRELIADDKHMASELLNIADTVVGKGVNYSEKREQINKQLKNSSYHFLDCDDFIGFLRKHNYQVYGDFIIRRSAPAGLIAADAVRKYFPSGIRIYDETEISRLRDVMQAHYSGRQLPKDGRTAAMRISPHLILCGRGKYTAIENISINFGLFDEICCYLTDSTEERFNYDEIFDKFRSRFLEETSIDNAFMLHGVMKYYYSDKFVFDRSCIYTNRPVNKQQTSPDGKV